MLRRRPKLKKPMSAYLTDLEGSICDDLTGGNKSMYVPCLHCGKPTPEDLVAITPFGLQPVCSDNCLRLINNADHDIDTFNAIKEKLECQTQKTQQKK